MRWTRVNQAYEDIFFGLQGATWVAIVCVFLYGFGYMSIYGSGEVIAYKPFLAPAIGMIFLVLYRIFIEKIAFAFWVSFLLTFWFLFDGCLGHLDVQQFALCMIIYLFVFCVSSIKSLHS